jgi:putative colanic acid biosynthesis UDP-glucose lipid carrier transferase
MPKQNTIEHFITESKRNLSKKYVLKDELKAKNLMFLCKRSFDIFISFFFIITVLSWLIPIVALFVFIDSRGPLFFNQRRVGRYGKTFNCIKFRTMYTNIEADFKQASEDDPRITKVGRFLRHTNIDELPQFFNVLMGEMSIVGPRPHMYKDCRDFNLVVKQYKFRTYVKPGITGLAQLKGFRGPTDSNLSIIHRFKWDLFYVKKASILLDLRIIVLTAKQTVSHFLRIVFNSGKARKAQLENVKMQGKKQIAA